MLRWFIKLLPFFIVERIAFQIVPEKSKLKIGNSEFETDCLEIYDGIFLVRSQELVGLRKKQRRDWLENGE